MAYRRILVSNVVDRPLDGGGLVGRFSPYINAVGAMGDEGPSFTPPADRSAIRQPRGEDGGE